MRAASLFILIFVSSSLLCNETIKIGLFHHLGINAVNINIIGGEFDLYKNDNLAHSFKSGDKISVSYSQGNIFINSTSYSTSVGTKLDLLAKMGNCKMIITPKNKGKSKKITGHLSFWNRGKKMSIINTQDLDVYIAGVIEAEAGIRQNKEYYKVQAVICRTYALSNKFKHAKSGFHLCDEVHCQVYKGMSESNEDIIEATLETSDVVVVDQDIELITTAFHSNCGGQTINSEDVWSQSVPYLKSKKDTFCLDMPHSKWQKEVKTVHWMGFMNKKGISKSHDSLKNCSFKNRETHFAPNLHLKEVRSEFGLLSTQFSAEENGDFISVNGLGFGHGVGLCQEGAMKMSTLGYSYIDILHFYFTDIHVVPLSNFHLFRED